MQPLGRFFGIKGVLGRFFKFQKKMILPIKFSSNNLKQDLEKFDIFLNTVKKEVQIDAPLDFKYYYQSQNFDEYRNGLFTNKNHYYYN